jgi:tetratricopeptide (TPR) repeat protein
VAIEGPLKELGLHDVFQLLDLSRKTGVLRVTSPLRRNQGTVYFDQGGIVGAEVRSNPHPLGELLVRSGRLTETELAMARDQQTRGDARRLGEILVEMGALTQRELERQVRLQIEEVVFEVVSWQEGYFSFAEGPLADLRTEAEIRIPTEAVLMEGARRIDEWSRIERHVPHLGVVPTLEALGDSVHGALDLLPAEWEVLAQIDGERDLRRLAADLGRSEFEVAKTVFGLFTSGVITIEDPHLGARGEDGPGFAEQIAHVEVLFAEDELEAARLEAEALATTWANEPTAHALAARIALRAGRGREAETAARRALGLDPTLADGHRLLGDALVAQGRLADAAEWLDRWLALDGRTERSGREERDRVAAAIVAARTLDTYLRGQRE